MTCQDHLLESTNVGQWTAIYYVMVPPSVRREIFFKGSIFQQITNSRHLVYTLISVLSVSPQKHAMGLLGKTSQVRSLALEC